MIVLENVVGLLRGADFSSLCEALDSLHMQFGALVIDASRFVPQSRPRVFVVAVDREIDCRDWVRREPNPAWTTPALIEAERQLSGRVRRNWRWWDLPLPPEPDVSIEALIEHEPKGVRWNSDEETARLLKMMSPLNFHKVQQRVESGERSVGFLYKRTRQGQQRAEVRFDGIAGCLRTPTGGSSRQTLVIVEDGLVRSRLVSPREAARLMGVDDKFTLPDAYNDAYHAMGDGVAVPAVRWLSQHLLASLAMTAASQEKRSVVRYFKNRSIAAQLALAEEAVAAW
jgi:DNA (cytosine-5)-methyltransferase 1